MLNLGCGSGSESNNRPHSNLVDYRTDAPVFGAEIMPPLRYTVSLVNGIERNFYIPQKVYVLFLGQRFGSDIQQLRFLR